MKLNIDGFDSIETFKGKFYKGIYSGEGKNLKFTLENLLLLSILLGKGGIKDKANELFDLFDRSAEEKTGKLKRA